MIRIPQDSMFPKREQEALDHRIDLPSIGPRTIERVAGAGLAGVAVVAGSTIVAQRGRLGEAEDRARVFVIGVDDARTQGVNSRAEEPSGQVLHHRWA
jgi:DUF1009 family protein